MTKDAPESEGSGVLVLIPEMETVAGAVAVIAGDVGGKAEEGTDEGCPEVGTDEPGSFDDNVAEPSGRVVNDVET